MVKPQTSRQAAAVLLAVLVMAGCFKRPSRGEAAAEVTRRVTIEVENNHWATVVVYAVVNGQSIRMGEVNTGTTTSMLTPPGIDPTVVDFRLRADPIGQREIYTSGSIPVYGGGTVLLTVENDIRNSRIRII